MKALGKFMWIFAHVYLRERVCACVIVYVRVCVCELLTLYGGTILPGIHGTREINIGTVYESIG